MSRYSGINQGWLSRPAGSGKVASKLRFLYTVYILYSRSLEKYYTGQTNDLPNRIFRHNSGEGNYSKIGIPWELIWRTDLPTRSEAVKRESLIKKQGAKRYLERIAKTI